MSFKHKRISADEAVHRAGDRVTETARGMMLIKAAKAPASWDERTRSARFVMTSEAVDRYGDVILTAGIDTTEFQRNPVALLFHNSRSWQVGNWSNVKKILNGQPARMEGDCVILPAGGPVKEIDETAWMLANGGIKACSIGFIPVWDDVEMILDAEGKWTGGLQFNSSELVECSLVPVPANADALVKGIGGLVRRITKGFRGPTQTPVPSLRDIPLTAEQQEQARAAVRAIRLNIEARSELSQLQSKVEQAIARAGAAATRSRIRSVLDSLPATPATAADVAQAKREAAQTRSRIRSSLERLGGGR